MTFVTPAIWSTDGKYVEIAVSSSAGQLVTVTNSSTAITITNPASTAATDPWVSAPGFNLPIVSASSGSMQIAGTPLVIVTTSAGYGALTGGGAASTTVSLEGNQTGLRLRVTTSVGSISTAPGRLFYLHALSTAVALAGAYLRLYDLTTGNATSSSNAGLAGAVGLLRIRSSVAGGPGEPDYVWPQGVRFATACSYDIVLNATSTATQTAGWVTAQYTT